MTGPSNTKTARFCLVDVCGTLYEESTTAGFVRFLVKNGTDRPPLSYRLLETLRRPPLRTCVIVAGKLLGRDFFRSGYITLLRGRADAELRAATDAYAAHLDLAHQIEPTHERVKMAETDGWEVILASNSLDIVIEAIARRMGVRWCASSLAWRGDLCAGHLARDLKGQKLAAVKELLGDEMTNACFMVITDNKTDRDLINVSSTTVLVTKDAERAWMEELYDELICH